MSVGASKCVGVGSAGSLDGCFGLMLENSLSGIW